MIATKDSLEPKSADYVMPNSRRVYVNGELHPDIRIPFREISQAPTKNMRGEREPNESIRVYDTSGPWRSRSITGFVAGPAADPRRMDQQARGLS